MRGPFTIEEVKSFTNGDLIAIKEADKPFPLAYVQHFENATLIVEALDKFFNPPTVRNNDPTTSDDAAVAMSVAKKSKRCQEAILYFQHHGNMSDEMLHLRFIQNEAKITPDRVRHIRKTLERAGFVEKKPFITKTDNGCDCRVYGLAPQHSSNTAHD